jgi:acetyl esterase/lipase
MTVQFDVVYGTGAGRELRLDIFPADPQKKLRTAVLQFHGGGWRMGNRQMLHPQAEKLSSLGFTCCTVEYRLVQESPWPAQLYDVKAAIRWVRAHAEDLDIDADRIVLQGYSAGGHLSLIAAGTPNWPEFEGEGGHPDISTQVAAVMAVYPPTEFFLDAEEAVFENQYPTENEEAWLRHKRNRESFPSWVLLGPNATLEAIQQASPITYITPEFPPTILLHGTSDPHVPHPATVRLYQKMVANGVKSDLHLYSGQAHGFDRAESFLPVVQEEAALFFRRMVSEPEDVD